ncbi:uncharacterized protein E0L32_010892 [Thyridium curvatum]|uniref:JmjC domain-containing protein n=1 Tax=Thyridium curvatum TaxID=1093900 RepID=A0A507AQN5_9PEZI|nr:uncharacterized protein E0L32_010892 [Thyridium curvatum]TPX07189.1 hypothetical protein E0L32_010892 [Thyridium curvatum]
MAQARRYLERGHPPKIPILVPPDLNPHRSEDRWTLEGFLSVIRTRGSIDVPVVDKRDDSRHDEGYFLHPRRMDARGAVERFEGPDAEPINMININGLIKDNPVPPCLQDLKDYAVIQRVQADNGKLEGGGAPLMARDLTDSLRFHLLAHHNVFHLPHIDRHGVITSVFTDTGNKLWPLWPGQEDDRLKDWAAQMSSSSSSPSEVPRGPVVALHLPPGSLLVQPAGTINAPVTRGKTVMTGTMHLQARAVEASLRQTVLQVKNPSATNKPMAAEYRPRMRQIVGPFNE